jgi:hypothetical protein
MNSGRNTNIFESGADVAKRCKVTDRRRRGDAQFGAWHDVSAVV